jgi:hypothetical protein
MIDILNKDRNIIIKLIQKSKDYDIKDESCTISLKAAGILASLVILCNLNIVPLEKSFFFGIFTFIGVMFTGYILHVMNIFVLYNKKEQKELRSKGIIKLINDKEIYTKKTLNESLNMFNGLSRHGKEYFIKNIDNLKELKEKDLLYNLIIQSYSSQVEEDMSEITKIDKFKLLNKYIKGIKGGLFINDLMKDMNNKYNPKESKLDLKKLFSELIKIYLKESSPKDFFSNKDNLIKLIEETIDVKAHQEFSELIEEKLNNFNKTKKIKSCFEKFKTPLVKKKSTKIIVKNI